MPKLQPRRRAAISHPYRSRRVRFRLPKQHAWRNWLPWNKPKSSDPEENQCQTDEDCHAILGTSHACCSTVSHTCLKRSDARSASVPWKPLVRPRPSAVRPQRRKTCARFGHTNGISNPGEQSIHRLRIGCNATRIQCVRRRSAASCSIGSHGTG